jgi:uncharacterized damage-inducible protein DinB
VLNVPALLDLYRHMEWADAMVWTSVLASEGGRSDKPLRDYLYHLHMVQRAFLRAWRGEPRDTPYPTFDDAPSMMEWGRTYYTEVFNQLETLSDEQVSSPMPLPWATMVERALGRPPHTTTVGETVLQVALHSTYHRGQINARLRAVGGTPPLVDYIAWLWHGRPDAQWPARPDGAPQRRTRPETP